jgi:hypothetical protein
MRRLFAILAILTSTTACSSIEPLRPDMEARALPSRADEIAYINGLRQAYGPTTNDYCYDGKTLPAFRPKFTQGYREWDDPQELRGSCIGWADPPKAANAVQTYLENGFGLTDLYCQRYFTIATETRQSRKLQQQTFKAGDALINAVMLALSSPERALGLSHAGFSAIDTTYRNIDEAFVVAPTREDVRDLVHGAQQKFRSEVFAKDSKSMPKSYASARAVIESYAGLCSFDGMRQLVANSVKQTTDKLNDDAARAQGGQEGAETGEKTKGATTGKGGTAPPPAKPAPDRVIPMVTVSPQ